MHIMIVMRVTINLDTALFENVEKLRGDVSRSLYVKRALEKYTERQTKSVVQ